MNYVTGDRVFYLGTENVLIGKKFGKYFFKTPKGNIDSAPISEFASETDLIEEKIEAVDAKATKALSSGSSGGGEMLGVPVYLQDTQPDANLAPYIWIDSTVTP